MVKHGFRGFLFIVCINKDVRSSDKRGVWQLFLYKLPLRGFAVFGIVFAVLVNKQTKK